MKYCLQHQVLRQLGQDKQSSAAVCYQSLVMGWTVYQHKFRLAFKIHFLIYITVGSDTASNTQAAQSPARWQLLLTTPMYQNFIMKYNIASIQTSLLVLVFFICFSSCGQKISHQDALTYCTSIQQEVSLSKKSYDISFGEIKVQIKNAQQSDIKKVDKIIVDTLRKHFRIFIDSLDKNIDRVNLVTETDTQIDFKNKTLAYLNALKKLELMSMPQTFDLLENGLNTLTDKQKEDNKQVFVQSGIVKTTNEASQKAYLEYLAKYSIKDEELKKFGLAN